LVQRFLEWCCHLSLTGLAHVVFVASIRAAMLLEKEAGLQFVRDIMWVDFPNENRVRQVLEQAAGDLTTEEQDMIVERLGGDMKEMAKVVWAVQRGTPVALAVEERIVEAVQVVEREMARLVANIVDVSPDGKGRQRAAGRFCRLWRLMKMFSQKPRIERSKLIEDSFGVHLGELTKYVEHGLLTYTLPRNQRRLVGESRLQARFPRTVWPDEVIAVGSPSVREAFTRVIEMPHYMRTFQWARAIAKRNDLDDEERELTRLSKSMEGQANIAFKLAELLSKNSKDWAALYGEGGEAHIAETWRHAYTRAVTYSMQHEKIEDELMAVQMKQRALQEKSAKLTNPVRPVAVAAERLIAVSTAAEVADGHDDILEDGVDDPTQRCRGASEGIEGSEAMHSDREPGLEEVSGLLHRSSPADAELVSTLNNEPGRAGRNGAPCMDRH